MIRSCVRQAVRAFAGAALVGCAWQAFATTFTMNCDSLTLTGTPPNQVLTCNIGSAPPSGCSIQGPSSGVINTAITLSAVCTAGTAPLTYAWSGGAASCGNQQQCNITETASGSPTYTVAISNPQGSASPSPTKQVTWSNTVAPPSNCSITPTPSSLPVGGGAVSLTAQCSGGAVDTWNWTNATYTTTSGNTASATIASTATFKVTATNGGGSSNAQVTVNVATGGGGGPISCSGYLGTSVLTLTWPFTGNARLAMGPLDAGVVVFTTGSNTGTGGITLSTAGNNAATHHDYTLSDTACDFGTGRKQLVDTGAPQFGFKITAAGGSGQTLKTNTTYYINVRNTDGPSGCALQGLTCDLYPINLQGP